MTDAISAYLVSYGIALTYDDLPPEVIGRAKQLLIDTLGCGVGGSVSETGRIVRTVAERVCPQDGCATILGSGRQSTPELAAFANGAMMRYLDCNDGFFARGGGGHPSDNFAPVLACGEAIHANGKEFLVASVLAYEVFCRLQDQLDLNSRGFDQAVIGVISSALGVSKILGLSPEQFMQAINLAVAPNISLLQTRRGEVSMWKGCAVANAARNAIFAALLAKEGMSGPSPIFAGRAGFMHAVSGFFQLEKFGGHGQPFRIMEVSIKRYPCGKFAQTAIDAAIKLRARIPSIDEICRIHIGTSAQGKNSMAGDAERWHPETRETADHSIPYVVAVALLYGAVEVEHFSDHCRQDQRLLELIGKITVAETDECNNLYPEASANRVDIITAAGETFSELAQYHRGHYLNFPTDAEIEEKFHALAGDVLSRERRQQALAALWNLEQIDDVGKVMNFFTP